MAQLLLKLFDVEFARLKHRYRKGVAQGVGGDVAAELGFPGEVLNHVINAFPVDVVGGLAGDDGKGPLTAGRDPVEPFVK